MTFKVLLIKSPSQDDSQSGIHEIPPHSMTIKVLFIKIPLPAWESKCYSWNPPSMTVKVLFPEYSVKIIREYFLPTPRFRTAISHTFHREVLFSMENDDSSNVVLMSLLLS